MNGYVELTYGQVGLAALLIAINAAISLGLQLKMERSLLIASLRTVVQLLLIGMVLEWVFRLDRWYIVLAVGLVMTLIASGTAVQRSPRRYASMWIGATLSMCGSSWLITAFALFAIVRGTETWYEPQYAIPLLGMVLGNTLNGISLGLNALTDSLISRREQVETILALGGTRWEAALQPMQQAVRNGMIPIINSMMIVGIVSLPGMMTGQLVAGMAPIQAVKYQIVIMFLVASATALGTVSIVLFTFFRLFTAEHQFRRERLTVAGR